MDYKKNKKKFNLKQKKTVALKAIENKRKLEASKPADVWNAKRQKWVKPSSQVGYKAVTVREVFTDMMDEKSDSIEFKSCLKFVGRCENLMQDGKFDIEGNATSSKFRVAGSGPPTKAPEVRKALFSYFIDVRTSLKGRLPKSVFITKAKSLFEDYCEDLRKEGKEPPILKFSNRWLKGWCSEYQISIKKPNKRFKISADARKSRIIDFVKNVWTARHAFMKMYGIDPPIIMSDQMPLHRNENSDSKTLNFKGAAQTTYVKENYMLSRDRITVMTSVTSSSKVNSPKMEFVFKGKGTRTKLNPPADVTTQWAPKGSYRLETMLTFIDRLPQIPVSLFPKLRKIYTLDDYSVHLDPAVSEKLMKKGYFPIILGGGITGDIQVNDTDLHHPSKKFYRAEEANLMLEQLEAKPNKIPSPSRDDVMKMFKKSWEQTVSSLDTEFLFKKNALTINLDGSEDHLVSNSLTALVMTELKVFREELLKSRYPNTIKKLQEAMIPPEGVKRNQNSAPNEEPHDEGAELFDGEFINEEAEHEEAPDEGESDDSDEEDNEEVGEIPETSVEESSRVDPYNDPAVVKDLLCLERVQGCIDSEKAFCSQDLLPFFVKVENLLSMERHKTRKRAKNQKPLVTQPTNSIQASSSTEPDFLVERPEQEETVELSDDLSDQEDSGDEDDMDGNIFNLFNDVSD